MMYYKRTPPSSARSSCIGIDTYMWRILTYKLSTYYKPTLFRADVREIAHGLIIRIIQVSYYTPLMLPNMGIPCDRIHCKVHNNNVVMLPCC